MRFGVTGHQILPPTVADLAVGYWTRALPLGRRLRGVAGLAEGADQLFAELVLKAGGRLEVIVPCMHYSECFTTDAARTRFKQLRQAAEVVITLPYPEPSKEAFLAAGLVLVERCDYLFAIWDGQQARGLGGTADVVAYARARRRRIKVLWPDGVTRA